MTIRTLDPPCMNFFLATREVKELADTMGVPVGVLQDKVTVLHEFNPMRVIGAAGWEFHPEITEMQARAIFGQHASAKAAESFPEVMIPPSVRAKNLLRNARL